MEALTPAGVGASTLWGDSMYNISIHCQQVLGATVCYVSLSETPDDGSTSQIATSVSSSNLFHDLDEDPVWIFVQQVSDAVSRALSTEDAGVLWQLAESAGLDGGWRGAGNPGQPERSEDQ